MFPLWFISFRCFDFGEKKSIPFRLSRKRDEVQINPKAPKTGQQSNLETPRNVFTLKDLNGKLFTGDSW